MRDMTHSRVTWLIHTGCRWLRCIWMNHVTYECVTRWPDLFVLVTWLVHAWHDPLIYASLFMHVWMDSFMCEILDIRHDSFLIHTVIYASLFMTHACVTWLMHVSHDPFACDSCATWLIHMWHDTCICDMTHSCVTWRIHVWHDSFICNMAHFNVKFVLMPRPIHRNLIDAFSAHVSHDSFICDMTHLYITFVLITWRMDRCILRYTCASAIWLMHL